MTNPEVEVDHWFQTEVKKEKITLGWKITNIDQLLISAKVIRSEKYRSDKCLPLVWHLGLKLTEDDHLSLWAANTGKDNSGHISTISISILNSNDEMVYYKTSSFKRKSIRINEEYGFSRFISRSDLETSSNMYIPDNTLRISVQLEIAVYLVHHKPYLKKTPGLEGENYEKYFKNRLFSDVILSTPDEHEIPAHKLILSSKSGIFAKIFEKNPDMKVYRMINWTSFEMTRLIEFIYTGTLDDTNDFLNEHLLGAAHEFEVWELKNIIEECLATLLTLENAVRLLELADKIDASYLKVRALNFIETNIRKFIVKKEFHDLMSSSQDLMMDVFKNIAL